MTDTHPTPRKPEHDVLITEVYDLLAKKRHRTLNPVDNMDALQQCLVRLIETIDRLADRYSTASEIAAAVWASGPADFRRSERIQRGEGARLVRVDGGLRPNRQVISLDAPNRAGDRAIATDRLHHHACAEQGYDDVELRYDLAGLLRLLPERIRYLLWLVRVEGLDVTAAAEQLGWSRSHTSRQLHKSEARLRRLAEKLAA